uniref:O-fucosyltransferase family protein n=1 Tax=Oryza brachyantha TaxID=4533 RepID=J3L019_ORYBR
MPQRHLGSLALSAILMRSQICNAVAIAKIMNATLILPVLKQDQIWKDQTFQHANLGQRRQARCGGQRGGVLGGSWEEAAAVGETALGQRGLGDGEGGGGLSVDAAASSGTAACSGTATCSGRARMEDDDSVPFAASASTSVVASLVAVAFTGLDALDFVLLEALDVTMALAVVVVLAQITRTRTTAHRQEINRMDASTSFAASEHHHHHPLPTAKLQQTPQQ